MNDDYQKYEDSAAWKLMRGCLIAVCAVASIPILFFVLFVGACLAIRFGSEWEDARRQNLELEVNRLVAAARSNPGDQQYTQRLLAIAQRDDKFDVSRAVEGMGGLGEVARPLVPEIAARLKDDDRWVRMYAVRSLAQLGPISEEALPELIRFVRRGKADNFGMEDAIEAIARIGKPSIVALPMLREKREQGGSRIERDLKRAIDYLEKLERGDLQAVYDNGGCCCRESDAPEGPASSQDEVLDESHSVLEG